MSSLARVAGRANRRTQCDTRTVFSTRKYPMQLELYYTTVLDLLHGHHEGEDQLLTPRLLERMPDEAPMFTRIGQQHQTVLAAVAATEGAIVAWRAAPSAANRPDAAAALATLAAGLTPHLDEEEREILPIAAQCVNVAECGQLPEHGMRSFRGDKMWLILGLVQEQITDAQKATMEAHTPTPLLELWNGPGRACSSPSSASCAARSGRHGPRHSSRRLACCRTLMPRRVRRSCRARPARPSPRRWWMRITASSVWMTVAPG